MDIIPAIDIQNGKCVRLQQGDFKKETIFSENPIEMAKKWATYGIRRLHIVDLDGARSGDPTNYFAIKSIRDQVKIPIQVGGGIRTMKKVRKTTTQQQSTKKIKFCDELGRSI